MVILRLLAFTLSVLTLPLALAERIWLNNTGLAFEATYESLSGSTVKLKSKEGKVASFPINTLSIVDKLYLIHEHGASEKIMLTGFEEDHEKKYKVKRTLVKKGDSIDIQSNDTKVRFQSYRTPNFEFWVEEKIDHARFADLIEKMWFYNSWRNVKFRALKKKRSLIIIPASELSARTLSRWITENHPRMSQEHKDSYNRSWGQSMRGINMIPDIALKRDLSRNAYIFRNDVVDFDLENKQATFVAAYTRFLNYSYEGATDHLNFVTGKGRFLNFSIGFDAELTFYDEISSTTGNDIGGSGSVGHPKDISKRLLKSLKNNEQKISIEELFREDGNKASDLIFASKIAALGRFLHSDMQLELGLSNFLYQSTVTPSEFNPTSLAVACGYSSIEEINEAFNAWLLAKKLR